MYHHSARIPGIFLHPPSFQHISPTFIFPHAHISPYLTLYPIYPIPTTYSPLLCFRASTLCLYTYHWMDGDGQLDGRGIGYAYAIHMFFRGYSRLWRSPRTSHHTVILRHPALPVQASRRGCPSPFRSPACVPGLESTSPGPCQTPTALGCSRSTDRLSGRLA